jgi:hypothetical protein
MTPGDHAPCCARIPSRGPFGQCKDLTVTQAVIDIGKQLAGRGNHTDVVSPVGDDPGRSAASLVPARVRWQASITAQRARVEPCLSVAVVSVKLTVTPVVFFHLLRRGWVRRGSVLGVVKARAKLDRTAAMRALTPTPPGRPHHVWAEKRRFSWRS